MFVSFFSSINVFVRIRLSSPFRNMRHLQSRDFLSLNMVEVLPHSARERSVFPLVDAQKQRIVLSVPQASYALRFDGGMGTD